MGESLGSVDEFDSALDVAEITKLSGVPLQTTTRRVKPSERMIRTGSPSCGPGADWMGDGSEASGPHTAGIALGQMQ